MLKSKYLISKRGLVLIELLTVIFILATLVMLLIPNLKWTVFKTQLSGCQQNLKNMSTALQLYANDNEDYYPENLDGLKPHYFHHIPTCPSASADTYSPGYDISVDLKVYTLPCKGKNHGVLGLGEDEPYWSMSEGLRP
ncbi:MAG: hypothetical protein K8T10_03105 [Candidatus Eremiobacteraeota bacterium]|nr:hypothetical protein [Candidatus Eremiobacteraeota bacterium]